MDCSAGYQSRSVFLHVVAVAASCWFGYLRKYSVIEMRIQVVSEGTLIP